MRTILISAGSAGNMLPFVGLGRCLRERGHQVVLAGSQSCREPAVREGLEFVGLDRPPGAGAFEQPDQKTRRRGFLKQLTEEGIFQLRQVYNTIAERYVPGDTVVACQGWLFGGRIAQERLGVPLATVHLQPSLFRSVQVGRRKWVPRFVRRAAYRLIDGFVDAGMGKAVNNLRQELGLAPVSRLMDQWWFSPQLAIGFFPQWFAPRMPDWPPQTLLAGFPLYDFWKETRDPAALEAFLAAGPPPLVFSQATIFKEARTYFEVCGRIAARMQRRAILLTAHPEQLPTSLPPDVKSFGVIPLSELLPRAAAFIHHGGMGSLSQALVAGVPQLTVPKLLDQHDNSRRLEQLGVSINLKASQFRPEQVAPKLEAWLSSASVAGRCREYAELSTSDAAFSQAANALERLAECPVSHAPPG